MTTGRLPSRNQNEGAAFTGDLLFSWQRDMSRLEPAEKLAMDSKSFTDSEHVRSQPINDTAKPGIHGGEGV